MTTPRPFPTDAAIRRVGEGLLARTLPKPEWTHEAHLAACLWLLRERPDITPERDLPGIIRAYNIGTGGQNSDTEGYHETITQAYIALIRDWLRTHDDGRPLARLVNAMLTSPLGGRAVLLTHWSQALLMSVAARREWVAPDFRPLPAGASALETLS